jgi:hypothetical protein
MMPQTLTYTTDAAEDAVLASAVAELNAAELASGSGPGTWTAQTFVSAFGVSTFIFGQGQRPDIQGTLLTQCIAAFATASSGNQATVLGLLGLTAYAGLPLTALGPIFVSMGLPAIWGLSQANRAAVFAALGF